VVPSIYMLVARTHAAAAAGSLEAEGPELVEASA